jgi:hypothetical protein
MQGLEVYAANGEILIDINSRMTRSVTSGTTASIANGASVTVTVTGMQTDDYWQVFVAPLTPPQNINARFQDCTRNSGSFTITNNMGAASAFDYVVIRSG